MYSVTTSLEKIDAMDARTCVVQGGTSAGKTIAILMILIDLSFEVRGKVISVVTDTFPNLRRGAMRDFSQILERTKRSRYFESKVGISTWRNLCTDTLIEFYSCDQEGALGARRDYLFVNEANRINYDTYSSLEIRTRGRIWIDFNPVNEFWVHREVIGKPDTQFIKLNYLDNEALDANTVRAIEARKGDGLSNWWRVYGLGEIGSLEGNIYEGWTVASADDFVSGRLIRYGLDFGFSNDETALIALYELSDGALGVRELLYEKGLLGSQYVGKFEGLGVDHSVLIVADSARPEIIAELRAGGFRVIGADKGAGSVKRGIDRVQARAIRYEGKDLEREFLTYAWRKKRSSGELIDEPQDGNDHLMDALRYAVDDLSRPRYDF